MRLLLCVFVYLWPNMSSYFGHEAPIAVTKYVSVIVKSSTELLKPHLKRLASFRQKMALKDVWRGGMKRSLCRIVTRVGPLLLLFLWATLPATGQSGSRRADWPTYRGDLSSTRYSPLDQITAGNFNTLQVAWRFKTDNLGPRPEFELQSTPLAVNGVLYTAGDVVIVGAAHTHGNTAKSMRNEKGYVRGFDVRTGKRLWIFHTIPSPGEFGSETWQHDSWSYTGNTGVWGQISVDEELGLVYLPVETPTNDVYGGHRPGNGLFGESLVAVDLKTGRRKWHYQFVHHGIWDYDIPCAPILADITVNGRKIKAVAQPTKQAWVYVFDRITGQPVWPIEERPVPQSDVPGEKTSATQPFPTRPPAFDRQGVSLDDLIDFTPELKAEAVKLVSKYRLGPIFTPAVVSRWEGPLATLMLPNMTGGTNWQGGALDPGTNILYIFSNTAINGNGLVPPNGKSDMNYISGLAGDPAAPATGRGGAGIEALFTLNVRGLPLVKPPYGRITAIDLNKGEIVWQIAHGETPDTIRNP